MNEHLERAGGVFIYSLAAILGIVAANYVDSAKIGPWAELVLGLAVFAIPVFGIRGNAGWEGPTRLFLGVAGATLVLRALLNPAPLGLTGLNASLPPEVSAVV